MYLEIDTRLRMAELGKHVGDFESAKNDFIQVVQLCKKYPEKNEETLTSAVFALGKLSLDQQDTTAASDYF